MATDTVIRQAGPDDVSTVLELIKALAAYEKLADAVVTSEDQLRESLFVTRAAEVLLAYSDGVAVGVAVYFHNFSTFLGRSGMYLEDIFVRPDSRGRGIGKQLFVRVAELAVERGCGRMEWSVLDWNAPAIGFYRKLGAVPMDEWTVFRLAGTALHAIGGGR